MEDGGEGKSWIGNIVQKFGDLFSEVDDVMQKEFASVTNQLQTVGANVVQVCLELVEDECLQSSENTEKEPASDIDVMDSNASKISMDDSHCENESQNENHLRCSSSVEPVDGLQFDLSVEQNVDTRVYKKKKVLARENLVKDKQSLHEMPLVVSPQKEESNNIEDASYCSSSPMHSSYSDYSCEPILDSEVTPAVPSTELPDVPIAEEISGNEITKPEAGTIQSFQMVELDDSCLDEDHDLKKLETIMEILANATAQDVETIPAVARWKESHISFLRREKPHCSMLKARTQNLDQILQQEEKLRETLNNTQEHESCDSDWVIV